MGAVSLYNGLIGLEHIYVKKRLLEPFSSTLCGTPHMLHMPTCGFICELKVFQFIIFEYITYVFQLNLDLPQLCIIGTFTEYINNNLI